MFVKARDSWKVECGATDKCAVCSCRESSHLEIVLWMTSGAVTVTVTTATPPSAPDVPTAEVEVDIAEVGRATVPFAFLSAAALMPAALNSESAFASLVQVSIWT